MDGHTFRLTDEQWQAAQDAADSGMYADASEAVRDAIRQHLMVDEDATVAQMIEQYNEVQERREADS